MCPPAGQVGVPEQDPVDKDDNCLYIITKSSSKSESLQHATDVCKMTMCTLASHRYSRGRKLEVQWCGYTAAKATIEPFMKVWECRKASLQFTSSQTVKLVDQGRRS
ncbi:hypothetical protein FPSE_09777 [Fusarium pseudograminearum CS3096]|uniref:Uncharacterized protein n=1 Tax=Fusarium pseudograminearum (strain CS3096) TaxID=1028729 RepID=K3VY51_FUSPC|nr:hypothetical protein FPSE_09777 [Fusarium pseudograminearum CS3096]EKJ70040.1 hypothetical protein FPSE_09777 [Fusarium pseudograminearum CS3096]